jgi:mannose-6-phosphate isomerase-like protein (cupin superfamily)
LGLREERVMTDLFSAETGAEPRPRARATVLVAGESCEGRFAIVETHERHGFAAPCHIHSREDEFVYVLAGRILVQIGEAISSLGAGECLLLPRGYEHAIVAESPEARLLLITTPSGIEGYYRDLELAPADDAEGIERLITIAARYGLTITGPALNTPG